ncbi:hypothetical protein [Moraxella lacunata]|uniref:Uncharacterized protein n=1 Tax=Moraxella lacunata TaxID=477 RepID=A0A1V4H045_MORLA|nr:hypothetical protein [Moraxella lacunata]OPH38274.1 hypothetical protein B5J94_03815 [Moraxella lacunata]
MKLTTKSPTSKAQSSKKWLPKALLLALMGTLGASIYGVVHADDLEIYQRGGGGDGSGGPTMMIAITLSAAMGNDDGSFRLGYKSKACINSQYGGSKTSITTKSVDFYSAPGQKNGKVSYTERSCNGKLERESVLKAAFINFMANPYKHMGGVDITEFKIGLSSTYGGTGGVPNGVAINMPAVYMTPDNRKKLIAELDKLSASQESAPLSLLYSETIGYLLGKDTRDPHAKTEESYRIIGFSTKSGTINLCHERDRLVNALKNFSCKPERSNNADLQAELKKEKKTQSSTLPGRGPNIYYYAVVETTSNPYSVVYDMMHPLAINKDPAKGKVGYISPLTGANQCGANGVYFLTDGAGYPALGG